ncbi:MAG: sulfatase/phosphatase domain-containing protein, partial [Phycisphaeraceae bacterium JB051]
IVDHLESRGLMDSTILCFASDHGETLGSHGGLMDKGIFHFDEIQRVPLFMRLPGDEHAGERNDQLVSLVDMYPTILSAAGADYPADQLPGRSIFDLIDGCDDWREDLVIQSEGVESVNITLRTLRHDKYKYGFTIGMKEQLYDLHDDPHEMTNLVDEPQYADVLNDLRTRLVKWMQQQGDRCVRNGVKPYLLRMGWQEPQA